MSVNGRVRGLHCNCCSHSPFSHNRGVRFGEQNSHDGHAHACAPGGARGRIGRLYSGAPEPGKRELDGGRFRGVTTFGWKSTRGSSGGHTCQGDASGSYKENPRNLEVFGPYSRSECSRPAGGDPKPVTPRGLSSSVTLGLLYRVQIVRCARASAVRPTQARNLCQNFIHSSLCNLWNVLIQCNLCNLLIQCNLYNLRITRNLRPHLCGTMSSSSADGVVGEFLLGMDLTHLFPQQTDFVVSIRAVEKDAEGNLVKCMVLAQVVADMCPPALQFFPELICAPVLCRALLTLLNARGEGAPVEHGRRNVGNLSRGLNADPMDTATAVRASYVRRRFCHRACLLTSGCFRSSTAWCSPGMCDSRLEEDCRQVGAPNSTALLTIPRSRQCERASCSQVPLRRVIFFPNWVRLNHSVLRALPN